MNIFFVTSLPRTGTTSLCKMAEICGLKSLHVLKKISFSDALDQGYNFFADTPFYCPEFLVGLLELGLKTEKNNKLENIKVKFIYSHREQKSHENSISKLLKKWQPPQKIYNPLSLLDHLCYERLNEKYIKNHYHFIKKISSFYKIDILDYNFIEDWKSFCSFIERPIPNKKLPHENKL